MMLKTNNNSCDVLSGLSGTNPHTSAYSSNNHNNSSNELNILHILPNITEYDMNIHGNHAWDRFMKTGDILPRSDVKSTYSFSNNNNNIFVYSGTLLVHIFVNIVYTIWNCILYMCTFC